MSKRILIVDDHPMFAQAVAGVIAQFLATADIQMAVSMAEAQALLKAGLQPDLVFLDLNLPDSPGSQSLQNYRQVFGETDVVIVSAMDDELRQRQAMASGAKAFLSKAARPEEMMAALGRLLADGQNADAKRGRPAEADAGVAGLSTRQAEVMEQVAAGLSNKEIARNLGVSPGTIKVHMRDIFDRLGVHNRIEALAMYQSKKASD